MRSAHIHGLPFFMACTLAAAPAGAQDVPPMPRRLPSFVRPLERSSAPPSLDDVRPLGLTGANKANAVFMRLRESIPPATPPAVKAPRIAGGREYRLVIAEPGDGAVWVGFYRHSPAGGWSHDGASYLAVRFAGDGMATEIPLDTYLLAPGRTEIQDVRLHGGRLFFNEACASYSSGYRGRCSTLAALDLQSRKLLWRTPYLVSNNIFVFLDARRIVAGYGFTAEPDFLYLVDATSGRLLGRSKLDTAHNYLEMVAGRLHVLTSKSHYVFELTGPAH